MNTSPFLSTTMVGDMDERGRLFGPGALATSLPPSVGGRVKSVSWLLSTKPLVQREEPNGLSTVSVKETALPSKSTKDMCDVPGWAAFASRPHMSITGLPRMTAPGSPGDGMSPGLKAPSTRDLTYLGSSRSATGTVTLSGSAT